MRIKERIALEFLKSQGLEEKTRECMILAQYNKNEMRVQAGDFDYIINIKKRTVFVAKDYRVPRGF